MTLWENARAVRQEGAHAASARDQNLPLNVAYRFLDFVITDLRIIRDLTVKKYLGAGILYFQ